MTDHIVINGDRFDLYLTEEQILGRVNELAAQINADYAGKVPIFIGILNGSFIFFSDLVREITVDCEVDFLKLSSYGDAKISSGEVRLLKDLNCQVEHRDIVIVEDIVDSGLSIDFIKKLIVRANPSSFRVVTLLMKRDVAKIDFPIDYVGFEIPPEFVIGYGLDYAQKVRNLRSIYRLSKAGAVAPASSAR
ncbi:MAG: hypoxanthine phosphoribosyltransferase [Ignavibacteria bacterium]|nr:hypoxanthine phosphoribosyltransferase [Ignavibacteria bacterium]